MRLGTPLSPTAVKVMLLGSGELGKEVAIELQRLGCEVIAVDRYAHAPAMQVAHRSHVIAMTDATALRALVEAERPHLITLYYSNTDHAGHDYGPNSEQEHAAVLHVDGLMGDLRQKLDGTGLPVDLVIVADHGMANSRISPLEA